MIQTNLQSLQSNQSLENIVLSNMDQQILKENHNPLNQNIDKDINMDINNDESSVSSHEDEDPFISLLYNQGAFF